jgi:hypothetical protein
MALKSRSTIAIDPGVKLKKKKEFSKNKGPIAKCQKLRGKIKNSHFSKKQGAISKELFITFFITPGKTDSVGRRNDLSLPAAHDASPKCHYRGMNSWHSQAL